MEYLLKTRKDQRNMKSTQDYDIEADVKYFASGSLKHINPCWIRFFLYVAQMERVIEQRKAAQEAVEEAQRAGEPLEGSANA